VHDPAPARAVLFHRHDLSGRLAAGLGKGQRTNGAADPDLRGQGLELGRRGRDPGCLEPANEVRDLGVRRRRLGRLGFVVNRVGGVSLRVLVRRSANGQIVIGRHLAGISCLAAEIGLTHEALYRTLATLERSGEITRKGEKIVLSTRI
jgi:hypothetical protein